MLRSGITEKTVLFVSIVKWFFLATVIGILTGLGTTVFLKTLNWSLSVTTGYHYYYLAIPFVLGLNALVNQYVLKDAAGEGTDKVIEAIHKASGDMKWYLVPIKLVATILTLAAGGSTGKEGPCAETGGAIAAAFANFFRFDDHDRRKLVICGISAGFASVFGTPIGGAIFGVEVLFIGSVLYDVLLPSFVAGIVSYEVSSSFGIIYFHHELSFLPVFSELFFLKVVVAGIFFGLCSVFLIEVLHLMEKLSEKMRLAPPLRNFLGGLAIVALTLIFSKRFLGLGLDHIESCLEGGKSAMWVFLMKGVFTGLSLKFGGSGGIVTPIFFIGSTAGAFLARVMHVDVATFAAIGLVSVLAGCCNTPLAASIMAIEIFGSKIAPYAAVSCVISFLMSGHTSVLQCQVLAIRKSPSLEVELGKEIEALEAIESKAILNLRKNSVVGLILRMAQQAKAKLYSLWARRAMEKHEDENGDDSKGAS